MKRNKIRILPARPSSGGGYLGKKENLEFERINKTKRKKLIIASILGIGIIIGGISLYRSYALYEEEKEYNVLKGQIPDFGYDVKFAVTIDGAKSNKIPERQKSADNSYYKVQVSCTNGSTQGEWDYNAWNVKLDDISDGSKCTLAFTGGMSKEEYHRYIEEGIATRRNTYRGKDLTEFFTKHSDEFYKQISEGTFDDIYVGDYIKTSNNSHNVTWLVADIDNYMLTGNGDQNLKKHHLTIIPAASLTNAPMNTAIQTKGGYYGSKMVSGCDGQYSNYSSIQSGNCTGSTLDEVYTTYIEPVFGDNHIIKYSNLLTTSVNTEGMNRYGGSDDVKGASNRRDWINNRKLDLMSEINVYGTIIMSSSIYDVGIDNKQYALFQLKPIFINSDGTTSFNYWLKDVTSSTSFAIVGSQGDSNSQYTDGASGVRPRFLIG